MTDRSQFKVPKSPTEMTHGMVWLPRMLDKIRLHAQGQLSQEYIDNLGIGFDGRCCRFLRIEYEALVDRVQQGGDDEEILEWCFESGRRLSDEDIEVWNGFISKRGWRDSPSVVEGLEQTKRASGLGHRKDILTFFHFDDVDEGRDG